MAGPACLRWVDDVNACTTLFVPHDWSQYVPPPRVLVRLTPRGATPAGCRAASRWPCRCASAR
ncbi:hypothetical protein FSC37_15795 [Piscinibacter aquaticus]|uniref:Uncharacterized protein n=1 Tax=Piscinibacter aquaticus TaxID=392597 RepID=A0A5C6U124_9BURK|nr:hypothetical protein FSC37_15795 [Piscinibacter aquaticus]